MDRNLKRRARGIPREIPRAPREKTQSQKGAP